MGNKIFDYDKNEVYEAEIVPLLDKIRQVCNENHIPCFISFGTKLAGGKFPRGEGIKCVSILPEVLEIENKDPFFAEFVNVMNGAKTYYTELDEMEDVPNDPLEGIDMDFGPDIE